MPGRGWAPKTAEVYESVIKRIDKTIGSRDIATFSVKDCAEFFRNVTESPRSRQQFRLVIGWILACGVEEGWLENNPALVTRKFRHERKRERLTLDIYNRIWAECPTWLRNAMYLSLLTLLRREDIVTAKFSDVQDGKLCIVPIKTRDASGVRLRITVDGALAELTARARDDIASPYIIHKLPEKARPQQMRAVGRMHHTQVLPEQLSRAFADAREAAKIEGENPPTFHEIRSLGTALLEEKGWTREQIQALMGHAEIEMTNAYLRGHEVPWSDVSVGLSLKQ